MSKIICPVIGANVAAIAVQTERARQLGADLVEIRLDLCQEAGADPASLIAAIGDLELPSVVTNRHPSEGGKWQGSDSERLELLLAADAAGAAYIDVELAQLEQLPKRPQQAGLILSYHDFEGMGGDLQATVSAMYAAGATVAKVAVTPQDAADLNVLADLCIRFGQHAATPHEIIAIGMGETGLPSRVLAGAWGSTMTFGRLPDMDTGGSLGQPTIEELTQRYRVQEQGIETRIFGVLGNPVGHSLSPVIHNTALIHHGIDGVYVPFKAEDAEAFWQACGDWIDGLSITIPHKTALLNTVDEVEELAHRIGAINTIYRDFDDRARIIGANTDAPAAVECVEDAIGTVAGRRVLLLGAGGVSRAIAFAMQTAGAEVTIANRTAAKAETLANEVGCSWIALEDATELAYDVLVNGTSVGMGTSESPWPAAAHRPETVIFDTVYSPLETRLLQDAQAAGCAPVCGLSMLIKQALGQFARWTDREAPEPLMQRAALEALGFDDETCAAH